MFMVLAERENGFGDGQMPLGEYIKERGVPKDIVIEVTNGCDIGNCPTCYMGACKGRGEDMSRETIDGVAQELLNANNGEKVSQIWLTGGEPTMSEDLGYQIRKCSEAAEEVCLITNGVRLADEVFVRKLFAGGGHRFSRGCCYY
jgi:molybdenum cofactor biosynthesis enzyme MoaA